MTYVKVSSKYQIVIPKEIRTALGLRQEINCTSGMKEIGSCSDRFQRLGSRRTCSLDVFKAIKTLLKQSGLSERQV